MRPTKSDPRVPPALATDSPGSLGDLAEVFSSRNIAVAAGSDGHVLLMRPDSVLVATPFTDSEARSLASFLDKYDAKTAGLIREGTIDRGSAFVKVNLATEAASSVSGESRWSLEAVNSFLQAAAARRDEDGHPAPLRAEYNYVVIGGQTVAGSPLGLQASWAGEMAFTGTVTKTEDGQTVLLTLAEPSVAPPHLRDRLDIPGHERPKVLILDTGLRTVGNQMAAAAVTRTVAHPDLAFCHVHRGWISDPDSGDVDDEDEEFDPPARPVIVPSRAKPSTVLDFEAGHGTFIAGIVRQICPDADIYSAGVLSSFGDGDVDGVVSNLKRVLGDIGEPVDVVVMSFGTNLINDDAGFFGEELLRVLGDAIGVAAAGNQSTCRPYFPAALPDVIGVGGLAADGKAWFTNFGGWVDACAPAVDVVSTFFNDFQEVLDGKDTRRYQGWARWSGTSFSAPKVAALIAQEMYLYGGTAGEAWKRLVSHKHFRYPDLGIAFNV